MTRTGKLLLLLLVAVGLGHGGEPEVPVFTEQPGWRNPHSKLLPGKSRNSFLCCSPFVLFCFILKSPHISDSTDSLRYEADYILLKTMPIAHKYQTCLWFQGIW